MCPFQRLRRARELLFTPASRRPSPAPRPHGQGTGSVVAPPGAPPPARSTKPAWASRGTRFPSRLPSGLPPALPRRAGGAALPPPQPQRGRLRGREAAPAPPPPAPPRRPSQPRRLMNMQISPGFTAVIGCGRSKAGGRLASRSFGGGTWGRRNVHGQPLAHASDASTSSRCLPHCYVCPITDIPGRSAQWSGNMLIKGRGGGCAPRLAQSEGVGGEQGGFRLRPAA